jgi:hypothetical protein
MPIYFGTDKDDIIDQKNLVIDEFIRIEAGNGNDLIRVTKAFVEGGKGNDTIIDEMGGSEVTYRGSPSGIQANLETGIVDDGWGTKDTLTNLNVIQDSDYDDFIIGSAKDNLFTSYNGDDTIDGGGGRDVLWIFGNREDFNILYSDGTLTLVSKNLPANSQGKKVVRNVETISFRGDTNKDYELYEISPESMDSHIFKYSEKFTPEMSEYYKWEGWIKDRGVAVLKANFLDIGGDGKGDFILQFWQYSANTPINSPTLNRLVIIEQLEGGHYKDTTAQRFGTNAAVSLGYDSGGVGYADFADINHDGLIDMVFALNRDDLFGSLDLTRDDIRNNRTPGWGDSYLTTIISTNTDHYKIDSVGPKKWNLYSKFIDLGTEYQLWTYFGGSQSPGIEEYSKDIQYEPYSASGQAAHGYQSNAGEWNIVDYPPTSQSFIVLPEFISENSVQRGFFLLWDTSLKTNFGYSLAGREPVPALMNRAKDGTWSVQSIIKPFDFKLATISGLPPGPGQAENGIPISDVGLIANDDEGTFALAEMYPQQGSFQPFPGADSTITLTRGYFPLVKDTTEDKYFTSGQAYTKLDFYSLSIDTLKKVELKIEGYIKDIDIKIISYIDFNDDDLTDIVVQGESISGDIGKPAVYLNTGAGIFVSLDRELFPNPPRLGSRSMIQVLDINGDGAYDMMSVPTSGPGAQMSEWSNGLRWPVFLGPTEMPKDLYKSAISIIKRMQSPLIKTQAGDDFIHDAEAAKGVTRIDAGLGRDTVQYAITKSSAQIMPRDGGLWEVRIPSQQRSDLLSAVEILKFVDPIKGDSTVSIESREHNSYSDLPDLLYQFFAVGFGAAPGVTYMDQMAEAYRYWLPQMGKDQAIRQIVEVFTTKTQFTQVFPQSLYREYGGRFYEYSHDRTKETLPMVKGAEITQASFDDQRAGLARALVEQIVGSSASATAKVQATSDIEGALGLGGEWSIGKVVYTVFGNLAAKPFDDQVWGNTAKKLANQVTVAKYYTDVLSQSTADVSTLRSVLKGVTHDTDTGGQEALATLVGVALLGDPGG